MLVWLLFSHVVNYIDVLGNSFIIISNLYIHTVYIYWEIIISYKEFFSKILLDLVSFIIPNNILGIKILQGHIKIVDRIFYVFHINPHLNLRIYWILQDFFDSSPTIIFCENLWNELLGEA